MRKLTTCVGIALAAAAMLMWSARSIPLRERYREFRYDRQFGIEGLVDAADALPYRPLAPRLTGGFAYRPHTAKQRGGLPEAPTARLYAGAAALSADAGATLHAVGLAHLLAEDLHGACKILEQAVKAEGATTETSDDAELLSDLAAAYYARGMREGQTEMLLTAIDLSSRAHALDPALPAPAFNAALAIESVHLPEQAIAAWNAYLKIDAGSPWGAEARAHVSALSAQVGSQGKPSVEAAAARLEAELLPAWGDAFIRGDGAAERMLRDAASAAAALQSCCGDDDHARAIAVVETASRSDRQLALRLAVAHQRYREGRRLFANNSTAAAIPLLESSRDVFRSAGDVFATLPWKYLAASQLYLGDGARALAETGSALEFCAARRCTPASAAHLRWVQALATGRSGDPQLAIERYGEALRGFEAGKQLDNAASIHALIADNLELLGVGAEAWPHRRVALQTARQSGTLHRLYIAFGEAADAALHRRHFTSARLFRDIVVDAARREDNTVLLCDTLIWRARVTRMLSPVDAGRDLNEAAALTARVADPGRRARIVAEAAAARAQIVEPPQAVSELSAALRYFEGAGIQNRLAELYVARAEAEEKALLAQLAESDYMRAVHVLESERTTIADPELRERFFAQGSDTFDHLIRHFWTTGRRDEAFRLAEQSRGRELNGRAAAPPMSVSQVRVALRAADAVVEYALLDDRMLVWIVRPSGVRTIATTASASTVADAVAALQETLDRGSAPEQALQRVAALVYEPVALAVSDAQRIVFVGNKSIRAVPFAALRDGPTRRYVVEEHEVAVVPNAAAYVRAIRRDRDVDREGAPSLVLASYTAGDAARGLPALQEGRAEARAIRALYARAQSFDDDAATPSRVLSAAAGATVVHVVAHGLQNDEHPELSSIVLAPSAGGRDLYASTIAATPLRATRLVFLSTCGTPGRTAKNDAPLTLPESFLAAGVPVVIGALNPVDDAATAAFAVALHRQFLATGDAVAALRRAQLECIASKTWSHPRFWSPWIAIGGTA